MEQLANALGSKPKPLIVAQSISSLQSYGPGGVQGSSWLHSVVGLGNFTVDADRVALGPVIDRLIHDRVTYAVENDEVVWYRVLRCVEPMLLEGTGFEVTAVDSLDQWLEQLGYTSPNEGAEEGLLTPLMCAAMSKRVDFVRGLLDRGAEVDATLASGHAEFGLPVGIGALHVSSIFGDAASAKLLFEAGANTRLRAKTPGGDPPLTLGTACGFKFDEIFASHPDLLTLRNALGVMPMEAVALAGHAENLQYHFERYPEIFGPVLRGETSTGRTLLSNCLADTWNEDSARLCIEAGCDVNGIGEPDMPKIKILYAVADAVCKVRECLGKAPDSTMHRFSYCSRCTPLHYAAYFGNLGGVEFLIAHGANVNSTAHPYQMTPLQLAEMRGHATVTQRLVL